MPETEEQRSAISNRNTDAISTLGYRGTLSLLRNVSEYHQYLFDRDKMTATKAMFRSRKKRQRQHMENELASSRKKVENYQELFSMDATTLTAFFFFHPRQAHSLRLRPILSEVCEKYGGNKINCIAVFGGDPDAATDAEKEDTALFLAGTGFTQIGQEDEAGRNACSSLMKFLDITQIPSVVVVPNASGRPIIGQEIALEWNADDFLMQQWFTGSSGLTFSQKVLSKTLGDSSSVCTVM